MWAIVQHVSYDGEGNIGDALRRAGRPLINARPYRGDPVPNAADLSGLVVLGAPGGSADDQATERDQRRGHRAAVLDRFVALVPKPVRNREAPATEADLA
jgi:hypothetical protein